MMRVYGEKHKDPLILGCFKKVHVSKRLLPLLEIRVIQSKKFTFTTPPKIHKQFYFIL